MAKLVSTQRNAVPQSGTAPDVTSDQVKATQEFVASRLVGLLLIFALVLGSILLTVAAFAPKDSAASSIYSHSTSQ